MKLIKEHMHPDTLSLTGGAYLDDNEIHVHDGLSEHEQIERVIHEWLESRLWFCNHNIIDESSQELMDLIDDLNDTLENENAIH